MIDLFLKKLDENAKYPMKKDPTDAGFDLYLLEDGKEEDVIIFPNKQLKLSTGIAVQAKFTDPKDAEKWFIEAKIEGTSGNASKLGIFPIGGVVDEGYTGEIGVVLCNHTSEPIRLKKGNKISQLIFHALPKINKINYLGVEDEFTTKTKRGDKGFGSSGIAN